MGETVKIGIEATSPADAAIDALRGKIKQLEGEMKKSAKTSEDGAKKFKDGMQQSGQSVGGLESSLKRLGPIIASVFSVATVKAFVGEMQKAMDQMNKIQDQSRLTMVQAAMGTGDAANLGAIRQFMDTQFRQRPGLSEQDIAAAYSASRSILKAEGQLPTAFTVAGIGLRIGEHMDPSQRTALIESIAAMEMFSPSGSPEAMMTRAAQVTHASQMAGQGGFDAVRGVLRGSQLEGMADAPGMMEDLLATANAAAARGQAAGVIQSVMAVAQRLRAMTDAETGLPMIAGSEAEIFQRMMRGEITPGMLAELGVEQASVGVVRSLSSEFGTQRGQIDALAAPGAAAAMLAQQERAVHGFLGPTKASQESLRRQELADRRNQTAFAEQNRRLLQAEQESLAEAGLPSFVRDPLLAGGRGLRAVGLSPTVNPNERLALLTRDLNEQRARLSININVDDGIPKQAGAN